jgi:hypothetical protein
VIAEGAGRVRVAARDAAELRRGRYVRLAGQLRDAADTAERAAAALTSSDGDRAADMLRKLAAEADAAADAAAPRY